MREQWRWWLTCAKQRRVRGQNAVADLLAVSSEIIVDGIEVWHGLPRESEQVK